jgi:hypothetical protein
MAMLNYQRVGQKWVKILRKSYETSWELREELKRFFWDLFGGYTG